MARSHSLKRRLILLVALVVGISLAGSFGPVLIYEWASLKASVARDLRGQAEILARGAEMELKQELPRAS